MPSNPLTTARDWINRITRGEGFLPGQTTDRLSPAEIRFRAHVEKRKDRLLAQRLSVRHPTLFPPQVLRTARHNIAQTRWGREWFDSVRTIANHVLKMSDDGIDAMIPDLTPTNPYGFTCPHCVGSRSQEGMGVSMFTWDYREPERLRCKVCGHSYPDARYPETGRLVCPRRGQVFTYYRNEAERAHPRDRSGQFAYRWVGYPIHVSFSGIIREKRILFMLQAVRHLGLVYRLTDDPRYARQAVRILNRFAHAVGQWLYHDYWDTVADCDPLYAAWHQNALPLEWKRHPIVQAYTDVLESPTPPAMPLKSKMLQNYWGAGRIHPSADAWILNSLVDAYDLVWDARDLDGHPLWSPAGRRAVERDLILEYAIGAEPFVGGPGKAENLSNKSPYVYLPFARVGRTLGLADFADVALRGYEALRDSAFQFDGFSRESPAYTEMYLKNLIEIPEILHGFRWPARFPGRSGVVDEYRSSPQLKRMLRAGLDVLRTNGKYLPLSDTLAIGAPAPSIYEIARHRFPRDFAGILPALYRGNQGYRDVNVSVNLTRKRSPRRTEAAGGTQPGEYAIFHLRPAAVAQDRLLLHDIFFPAWMTAILRHGDSVLALPANPSGIHRHADNLTLYYVDRGRPILGELGYVGDSALCAWGGSTQSHNLVVVDDADQIHNYAYGEPDRRSPSLNFMIAAPWVSAVEAESRAYPQCSRYRRRALLLKGPAGQTLVADLFRVRGGDRHAYRIFSEWAASDAPEGLLEFEGVAFPPEPPIPDFGGSTAREHVFGLRDRRPLHSPPPTWRAIWRQKEGAYRLHVLSPVHMAWAAHGPGQETTAQAGRRLRYLDLENSGADLDSVFVALHEPSGPRGRFPVRAAVRLPVPAVAGPDAVALRLETDWGVYRIFHDFADETAIEGISFRGILGVFLERPRHPRQSLICGESCWEGAIADSDSTAFRPDTPHPRDWPGSVPGVTVWVGVGDGRQFTGYPVRVARPDRIIVDRFPLQPATYFRLPSVRISG